MTSRCNHFRNNKEDRIMAQSAVTVRIDSEIKSKFDELCKQFGMSANTAFNVFVNAVVMHKKIPFEIKAEPERTSMDALESFREIRRMAEAGQFPDLTPDEINEEIRLAREERAAKDK